MPPARSPSGPGSGSPVSSSFLLLYTLRLTPDNHQCFSTTIFLGVCSASERLASKQRTCLKKHRGWAKSQQGGHSILTSEAGRGLAKGRAPTSPGRQQKGY